MCQYNTRFAGCPAALAAEGGQLSKYADFMINCRLPGRAPACDGRVLLHHERRKGTSGGEARVHCLLGF